MAIADLDPVLPFPGAGPTLVSRPARVSDADVYGHLGDVRLRLSLIRQGVLGDIAVVAMTVLMALVVDLPYVRTVAILVLVVVWRFFSFAALPAYDRATSTVPIVRSAQALGALAMAAVVAGVADHPDLRRAAIVLVSASAAAAASAQVHRMAMRQVPTVLIGTADQVERLASRWSTRHDIDVVDTYGWASSLDLSSQRAGVVSDVLASVSRHGATSVVVATGSPFASPAIRHLAWALQRAQIECLVVTDMNDHAEVLQPRRVGDQVAMSLRAPSGQLATAFTKSAIDRLGAAIGLLLLSPLLIAVAVAVRWDSRGPAVFSQVRSGRDGVPFRMYKFRSMAVDAESRLVDLFDQNEGAGPLFKMADDPRITRFGRFLRSTSIDELLQLVNVLKGEMSLVGPRPALPPETDAYDSWAWRRLHVKPGLTGLWQVSGRSSLTWEESVRKDLEYVNNHSLRLDLSILLRTVGAVLRRDGAV